VVFSRRNDGVMPEKRVPPAQSAQQGFAWRREYPPVPFEKKEHFIMFVVKNCRHASLLDHVPLSECEADKSEKASL